VVANITLGFNRGVVVKGGEEEEGETRMKEKTKKTKKEKKRKKKWREKNNYFLEK